MLNQFLKIAFISALVPLASPAQLIFDFESETTGPRDGDLTSLVLTEGGVTITITRSGGASFDVTNSSSLVSPYDSSFGSQALDPFFNVVESDGFTVNFSEAVASVSVSMGDYNPSDEDLLGLSAYSGADLTGFFLGSDNGTLSANLSSPSFSFDVLTVSSASGIQSISMFGGSQDFPHSVFYDNIRLETFAANPVPEPSALGLLGAGFLGLLFALRRRPRK